MSRIIEDDDRAEDEADGLAIPTDDADDLPYNPDDFGPMADEIDEFSLDSCVIKRGDRELYMFEGQRFWVHPSLPANLTNAYIAFLGGAQDDKASGMSGAFNDICNGLARCVVGWTLADPVTGDEYPQPWKNPDVFREIPTHALHWILATAVKGETPADRPNASTPRRGGSGTRGSRGQKTRSSNTAPRRR